MTVSPQSDDLPTPSPGAAAAAPGEHWWQSRQDLLRDYLWHQSRLVIIHLDRQKRILAANQGLLRLVGPDQVRVGRPLGELLLADSWAALEDFPEAGSQPVVLRLIFATQAASVGTLECRVYPAADGYTVLGEKPVFSPNETIIRLTALTEELATLNRELAQKNRELTRANALIAHLSRTDPLTGLANYRSLEERLEPAVAAARRHRQPLALVLADLDYFKEINDTYGHEVGNEVLRGVAALLRANCRREDLPVRWGGEEFLVLLSHTDRRGAWLFAERIRTLLAAQTFPPVREPVTASFGVAELMPTDDASSFIRRADQALYKAKNQGRNRTVVL